MEVQFSYHGWKWKGQVGGVLLAVRERLDKDGLGGLPLSGALTATGYLFNFNCVTAKSDELLECNIFVFLIRFV